jgi:hypothetical protein
VTEDRAEVPGSVAEQDETPRVDPRDDGQSELDLGVVSTGAADVDAALRPLETLTERPVSEHAEVYEQVLASLASTMAPAEPTGPPVDGHDG